MVRLRGLIGGAVGLVAIAACSHHTATGDDAPDGIANCGGITTCEAPTSCCESGSDGMCVPGTTGAGGCYGGAGVLSSCDGPEDCPGSVCCFVPSPFPQNPGPPSIQCEASASCTQVICRVDDDCPSAMPKCCDTGNRGTTHPSCTTAAECP